MTKILFVGAGNIAHAHYQAIQAAGATVIGVCTRGESGRQFAGQYGIPHYDSRLDALVDTCQPDAVMLLTQPDQYQAVLEILKPYHLPVFLEKPVGLTVEQAEALRPVLPDRVFVGLNRRFYGNIQAIYPLLQEEPPFMAQITLPERLKDFKFRDEITRNHWYMLNGIHGVDLITWLAGMPQVFYSRIRWGVLENCSMNQYYSSLYQTEKGHHVHFMANFDSPGGWRLHVYLRQKEIILQPLEKTLIRTLSGIEELPATKADVIAKPGFLLQCQTFLEGVQSPDCLPDLWVSFDEAVQSMRAVESLYCDTPIPTGAGMVSTPSGQQAVTIRS